MELRQRQQELQVQADLEEDTMNAIMEKGLQADLESVENYLEQIDAAAQKYMQKILSESALHSPFFYGKISVV